MDSKWILKSKTFWGMIISVAPMWLPLVGINLETSDIQNVAQYGNDLIAAIGGLIVIYGRLKGDKQVTLLPKP